MLKKNITLVVVASRARNPLILDYLVHLPHIVHFTTDYTLPPDFTARPDCVAPIPHQTGRYRCFRGHQDALKKVATPYALVLEDDAVPCRSDWTTIANQASKLLDGFELISLHGREINEATFDVTPFGKLRFLVPRKQGDVWVLGSLAYLYNMAHAPRFIDEQYDGFPRDLTNCRHYTFALIDPSPFLHDRSQGSLVEV